MQVEEDEESTLKKTLMMVGKVGLGIGLALLASSAIGAAMNWTSGKEEGDWLQDGEEKPEGEKIEPKTDETKPVPEAEIPTQATVEAAPKPVPQVAPVKNATIKQATDWVKPTTVEQAIKQPTNLSTVKVNKRSAAVESYIDEASRISGVDKALLLAVANQESQFKEAATVSTSSAVGLFQITSGTWSDLVDKYGKQYGIKKGDRADPRSNAIMGALYIKAIIAGLKKSLGRQPSVTDIYAGHMLGPAGVKKLLAALEENPDMDATELMPKASRSNPWVFKNKDGSHKTVSQVYDTLYSYVGRQYEKFAQEENITPTYAGSATGTLPQVVQASSPKGVPVASTLVPVVDKSNVVPVSFNVATAASNTVPVAVDFKVPPRDNVIPLKGTKVDSSTTNNGAMVMSNKDTEQETPNYIKRNGRLMSIAG
jgi:soluble lytic murein transglycosylase-like protein